MNKLDEFTTKVDVLYMEAPEYFNPRAKESPKESSPRNSLNIFFNKSPLAILEEGARGVYRESVKWNEQQCITGSNEVLFEMICSLYGVTVSEKSLKKKTAKQKAAVKYLHAVVDKNRYKEFYIPGETPEEAHRNIDLMWAQYEGRTSLSTEANAKEKEDSPKNEDDDKIPTADGIPPEAAKINWIGKIQELLQKNKMPKPNYEIIQEGPDNAKIFICVCQVSEQETRGRSTKKAYSKMISAYLMHNILEKGIGVIKVDNLMNEKEDEETDIDMLKRVEEEELRQKNAEEALKRLLADKNRFADPRYETIMSSMSEIGEFTMIIEISVRILPRERSEGGQEHKSKDDEPVPFVFCGAGNSEEEAKQSAYFSALVHFKNNNC